LNVWDFLDECKEEDEAWEKKYEHVGKEKEYRPSDRECSLYLKEDKYINIMIKNSRLQS